MPLYEISWLQHPSVLISATNVGQALLYLSQELGLQKLYQIDELTELKPDSFLLVRRCGALHTPTAKIPYAFCPNATPRLFLIHNTSNKEESILVIDDLYELPALVLWHYEKLSELECQNEEEVQRAWKKYQQQFRLLEIDTKHQGLLLSYEYCRCSTPTSITEFPPRRSKKDLEKPH